MREKGKSRKQLGEGGGVRERKIEWVGGGESYGKKEAERERERGEREREREREREIQGGRRRETRRREKFRQKRK